MPVAVAAVVDDIGVVVDTSWQFADPSFASAYSFVDKIVLVVL